MIFFTKLVTYQNYIFYFLILIGVGGLYSCGHHQEYKSHSYTLGSSQSPSYLIRYVLKQDSSYSLEVCLFQEPLTDIIEIEKCVDGFRSLGEVLTFSKEDMTSIQLSEEEKTKLKHLSHMWEQYQWSLVMRRGGQVIATGITLGGVAIVAQRKKIFRPDDLTTSAKKSGPRNPIKATSIDVTSLTYPLRAQITDSVVVLLGTAILAAVFISATGNKKTTQIFLEEFERSGGKKEHLILQIQEAYESLLSDAWNKKHTLINPSTSIEDLLATIGNLYLKTSAATHISHYCFPEKDQQGKIKELCKELPSKLFLF